VGSGTRKIASRNLAGVRQLIRLRRVTRTVPITHASEQDDRILLLSRQYTENLMNYGVLVGCLSLVVCMLGFLNALPRHMSRSLVAESSPRASAQCENGHCRFTKAIIAAVFLLPDFYAYYLPQQCALGI
jgi:hypothetical protein